MIRILFRISCLLVLFNFVLSQKSISSPYGDTNTVALWHMDEGSGNVMHDASGNNNNGTIFNADWVNGKLGSGLHFNGNSSYVILPNSQSLKQQSAFTVELFLSLDSLGYTRGNDDLPSILGNLGHYPNGGGWVLFMRHGTDFSFNYRSPNSGSNFTHQTTFSAAHSFYHVAIVFQTVNNNTRTTIKTYLDGSLTDSSTFSYPIQYYSTSNFYIGTNIDGHAVGGPGIREFLGTIDEIKISKVALEPSQFGTKYLAASPSNMDFNFVKVGEDSTAHVSLFNYSESDTMTVDSFSVSNNKFSVTGATGTVLPQSSLTFDVTYAPTQAGFHSGILRFFTSNTDFPSTDVSLVGKAYTDFIDTNVVADWHFDEGTGNVLHDASLYGNDGTINGNATWVPGKKGNALHFVREGSYVAVPNNASLKPENEFTIEAWINLDDLNFTNSCYYCSGGNAVIISNFGYSLKSKSTSLSDFGGFEFYVQEDSGLQFEYRGNHGYNYYDEHSGYTRITNSNVFYHVAEVYKRVISGSDTVTNIKTYVNGKLTDSTVTLFKISYTEVPYLYIGSDIYAAGYTGGDFPGIIDELRISKVARDPSEFDLSGITVSSNRLSMGELRTGRSVSKNVTVSNISFTNSVTVQVQGAANPEFTADTTGFTLAPRGEQVVAITYAPTDSGADAGTFTFTTTDSIPSSATVQAEGNGYMLYDAPRIKTVSDIPNDQGRQVRLIWYPSKYDAPAESLRVNEYSVWRKVDDLQYPNTAIQKHANGSVFTVDGKKRTVLDGELWDFVSTLPAVQFDNYAVVAPTLYNSTYWWWGHNTTFRVAAHTTTGEFFFSQPDSGYSLDNIYPYPPSDVYVISNANAVRLAWAPATDPDILEYYVYRSTESYFTITPSNKVATTITTSFNDWSVNLGTKYYYAVTSVDSSGNESHNPTYSVAVEITDVKGDQSVIPAEYYLSNNYPNPFNPSTTLKYGLPERSEVTVTVVNMLGQKVAELVSGVQEAGTYEALWKADVASGIYLYRINAVSIDNPNRAFSKVGKMLLLK